MKSSTSNLIYFKMVFLTLMLILVSCARLEVDAPTPTPAVSIQTLPVIPLAILPGEVARLNIPVGELDQEDLKVECGKKDIPFTMDGEEGVTIFISESYFSKGKGYSCFLLHGKKQWEIAQVKIGKKTYPHERLRVDKKRVELSAKDLKRVRREQKVLNRIYRDTRSELLFGRPFTPPLNSKITSIYGTRRIYNGNKKGQHLGTDYRAAIGTPIKAAGSGEVVLASDLFFTGKTVILYHGLAIFTVYGHLSKMSVSPGDRVLRDDIVGLSGVTGRVTGPHLHWGVKVNGDWVDGYSLIRESDQSDPSTN